MVRWLLPPGLRRGWGWLLLAELLLVLPLSQFLLGLPTAYVPGRWDALVAGMSVDKKARGDMLRFVVLDGIGRPGLLEGPDPGLLRSAYDVISQEA